MDIVGSAFPDEVGQTIPLDAEKVRDLYGELAATAIDQFIEAANAELA